MELKFPQGFFWGAATSAHQVEGGNYNDWSEWEKQNAERMAQIASLREWPNYILERYPNPLQPENYISGRACDHHHRYEKDFDIAKSLGHNAHRFSIEWSRIEPEEGKFDEKEIEHYRQVILALTAQRVEPFLTLWHWTNPLWIRDIGGWENKKTIKYFLRYTERIIKEFGEEIKFWILINEPNVYAGKAYIQGTFPPQVKSYWRANKVLKNLLQAHKEAYTLVHKILGDAVKIGSTHFLIAHLPYRPNSILDRLSVRLLNYIRNFKSFNQAIGYQDFIGVDYYHLERVEFSLRGGRWFLFKTHVDQNNITDRGWEIFPRGIYEFLIHLKKYNFPIYILENGLANAKDEKRTKFIKEHLFWIYKAIQEGVDIRGYLHWSLIDNFEWEEGFYLRHGLVEVDYKTLERKIRPSAWEFAKICKSNNLEI